MYILYIYIYIYIYIFRFFSFRLRLFFTYGLTIVVKISYMITKKLFVIKGIFLLFVHNSNESMVRLVCLIYCVLL